MSATAPALVLIRSAASPEHQRREARLFDELGLALDGFLLLSQPSGRDDFDRLPLEEQIADVLPEANKNGAMAVVWLSFPLNHQIMLHLVAIGSGRALVRTVETNRSPISEATLALMARELLGTAYLFESPKDVPLEVTQGVVRTVKEQIPPDPQPLVVAPPPPPPLEHGTPWGLWLGLSAAYPLAGGADDIPIARGRLAFEKRLPLSLDASVGVEGSYGAVARPNTAGARFLEAGAGAALYRGFSAGKVSLGPRLAGALGYATFQGPSSLSFLLPELEAGAQVRSEGAGLKVAAEVMVVYAPVRAELRSADQVLFRTASVALVLGVGFGWQSP